MLTQFRAPTFPRIESSITAPVPLDAHLNTTFGRWQTIWGAAMICSYRKLNQPAYVIRVKNPPVFKPPQPRIHPDRTSGGDRDHCNPCGDAAARVIQRERESQAGSVYQQLKADWDRHVCLCR